MLPLPAGMEARLGVGATALAPMLICLYKLHYPQALFLT